LQRRGIATDLDNEPTLAVEVSLMWVYFQQLHRRREYSDFGPRPLSWLAIQAWQNVRRLSLEPWEIEAILTLDETYFAKRDKSLND